MSLNDLTGLGANATLPAAEYERRITKLAKINAALMQRVERSMDQQANAFSLFQTAIGLEAQIRIRTEELKTALDQLEQANDELTAARDASDRANRVKTRFFTAVGHDLLQPLHAARLSLSALASNADARGNTRLIGQIDQSLDSIEELLKTILDLSKLEAGALKPALQAVPLSQLFQSLLNDVEPIAREKGLLLTMRPTDVAVTSDPLMLRRMVQNLLANAVRYTERGAVKLAARRRGTAIRIEVWDTGPGIAPSEQQRIFEEFQRGAAHERAGGGGFGLGLSIVQRMADTLGHRVELCSREGRGTRFSILAPFAGRVAEPAVRAERAGLQEPAAPVPDYGFAGTRVVVIDNDTSILTAMSTLLGQWGCETRLVRHLEELDDIVTDSAFRGDIILADYHLDHGENGLEAVRILRAAWQSEIPGVLVTADHTVETEAAAHSAGCELLRKPVRPAELRALLQYLLTR